MTHVVVEFLSPCGGSSGLLALALPSLSSCRRFRSELADERSPLSLILLSNKSESRTGSELLTESFSTMAVKPMTARSAF